jgi:hypothetical protein
LKRATPWTCLIHPTGLEKKEHFLQHVGVPGSEENRTETLEVTLKGADRAELALNTEDPFEQQLKANLGRSRTSRNTSLISRNYQHSKWKPIVLFGQRTVRSKITQEHQLPATKVILRWNLIVGTVELTQDSVLLLIVRGVNNSWYLLGYAYLLPRCVECDLCYTRYTRAACLPLPCRHAVVRPNTLQSLYLSKETLTYKQVRWMSPLSTAYPLLIGSNPPQCLSSRHRGLLQVSKRQLISILTTCIKHSTSSVVLSIASQLLLLRALVEYFSSSLPFGGSVRVCIKYWMLYILRFSFVSSQFRPLRKK